VPYDMDDGPWGRRRLRESLAPLHISIHLVLLMPVADPIYRLLCRQFRCHQIAPCESFPRRARCSAQSPLLITASPPRFLRSLIISATYDPVVLFEASLSLYSERVASLDLLVSNSFRTTLILMISSSISRLCVERLSASVLTL
jgi:hypothetical protein